MILVDPDHRAEVLRHENALEGVEDVCSAGDPQIGVVVLDHSNIGTGIKLFCVVLSCVVLFFVACLIIGGGARLAS